MNSRSVSDNLVKFTTELATLNQLEVKEPLLSFPFDHIYACHSDGGNRRQSLQLANEIEITTHCSLPHQDKHVTQRLASLESQNKKLKDLLIYHLDLIQQQNDLMSKREKVYQALRQENDTLKTRVTRIPVEKSAPQFAQQIASPQHVPVTSTITSAFTPEENSSSPHLFSTLNDLLIATHSNRPNQYHYDTGMSPDIAQPQPLEPAEFQTYMPSELETAIIPPLPTDTFTMIDNKRPKKEPKPINDEPKYTVTTSSGNSRIQRNRKRSTGIGSLSRMPKTPKTPKTESSSAFDDLFTTNKNSKSSHGKAKMTKYSYTALQERLQLIEPTPTGEDPYQLGEAEMREQSPIPKLMLQKTNHGRMRICSGADMAAGSMKTSLGSTMPTRRIYDTMDTRTTSGSSKSKRSKLSDRYTSNDLHVHGKTEPSKIIFEDDPDLDVEKTDNSDIDWRLFTTNTTSKPVETSLCDFSYGETSTNLINVPLDITKMEFPDFFEPGPANADSSSATEFEVAPEKKVSEKIKKRGARTSSLAGPVEDDTMINETKRGTESKRGRKRALSTATIKRDNQQKPPPKPRVRRAVRGKKTPVPGMTTKKLYHTSMGDPDLSWYYGLDPDIKKEDCDPTENTTSNVEVPRWREKHYSPLYSMEGTENLDDKVFEKRHQKLEAEERRQLRWHMRRVREQRHVEKLRQRQRDPWGPNSSQTHSRGEYTVWPQPIRDLQFIEITDVLPVPAFGEEIPDLPQKNFMVPWVRTSKPLKRSKRSKTLH